MVAVLLPQDHAMVVGAVGSAHALSTYAVGSFNQANALHNLLLKQTMEARCGVCCGHV